VAHLGWAYFGVAMVLGALLFAYAWALRNDPTPKRAMKMFGFSITYLAVLFIAMGAIAVVLHP
jgi:protoheme IX farnesyltransferase